MPLYHKWGLIFIQIPKNASMSIHYTMANLTDSLHSHMTYIQEMSMNDPELFLSYFSFACIRNPYDRFVSIYEYRTNGANDPEHIEFAKLIDKIYTTGYMEFDHMDLAYYPQYGFITIKDIILVDDLIRYEDINNEWKRIVKIINSRGNPWRLKDTLQYENITPSKIGKKWQSYYTPETAEMVYQIYKKDFELFGYEKNF